MTVPQPLSTTQVDVQDSVQTAPQQINLHAEYLPNIRQVTLYISLSESSDSRLSELQPEIHLSESRRAITVAYPAPFEDVSETIKLPSRVSEAARAALEKQMRVKRGDEGTGLDEHGREFSFRMQIDASEVLAGEEVVDAFVPWTAGDMSHTTKVRCRECEGVILNSPAGSPSDGNGGDDGTGAGTPGWIWKDLPSENWAEMMDFWHCHKPDPHEGDLDGRDHAHSQDANRAKTPEDPNAQVKGYGAANRVVATSGTVLVDVSSFLVSEVDCLGLKKVDPKCPVQASSSLSRPANIICAKCDSLIGIEDIPADGWRLRKSSLAVNSRPENQDSVWETLPVETVVAAQLLELAERESARRFAVHCGERSGGLLLWVFNPDLRYSHSSSHHRATVQQAMKVFFQYINDTANLLGSGSGTATPLSLEELEFPEKIFNAVVSTLEERNGMLPIRTRIFREWKVGILNRFERGRNEK